MSNSRVRKELEARQRETKKFEDYKKVESLLLNYQMCKAFFKESGASIIGIVEKILVDKYNLPWQLKFIKRATLEARGKKNATIAIPQFKYEENVANILSKFVHKNFEKMVNEQKRGESYPFAFRDIVERNS
jgi:hypothetical protein